MKNFIYLLLSLTIIKYILGIFFSMSYESLFSDYRLTNIINVLATTLFYYILYRLVAATLPKKTHQYIIILLILFANSIGFLTVL